MINKAAIHPSFSFPEDQTAAHFVAGNKKSFFFSLWVPEVKITEEKISLIACKLYVRRNVVV